MYIKRSYFKTTGTSYLELPFLTGKDVGTIGIKIKVEFLSIIANQSFLGESLNAKIHNVSDTQITYNGTFLNNYPTFNHGINKSNTYNIISINYKKDLKFTLNGTSVAFTYKEPNAYTSFKIGHLTGTTPSEMKYKYIEITEGQNVIARLVGVYNTDTSTDVIYDEINHIEYDLPTGWIVDDEMLVFKGITFEEEDDTSLIFKGITLEETDDLSLIFKGITFEVADKKLMDILFFGQS